MSHHIFGSEELSALAPAVAERAPEPYLALHPGDAAALGVGPTDLVELVLAGAAYRLPVAVGGGLPPGIAGLPVGLPGAVGIALPAWSKLGKVSPA